MALVLAGCGGADPPSCQQAMTAYYGVGCRFINVTTGQPIAVGEAVGTCQSIALEQPDRCNDELDDWLVCLDGATASDCDCSGQQMDLLTCQ